MSKISDVYEKQVNKAIQDWGRTVNIVYGDTAICDGCGYDPVNKEAINPNCSTCGGLYYYQVESNFQVKGVFKSFLTNMGFLDYSLEKLGYVPDSDARLTCWLEEVLIDTDSATGVSYLDKGKNIRVEIDGNKYVIQKTFRTGVDKLKVTISTLKEIK